MIIKRYRRIHWARKQRSAGRHLLGPIYLDWEHHRYPKTVTPVRYFNLTIGNPKVHYRWAFSIWFYYGT